MSTHNQCFGAKIRKIGIHLHTPVSLYKSGVQGGIHYTDMFSSCEKRQCHDNTCADKLGAFSRTIMVESCYHNVGLNSEKQS